VKYLLIIAIIVLGIVIGIMSLFAHLANKYYARVQRKRLQAIDEASPYRYKKPPPLKSHKDDFRVKDKVAEKRKQEEVERGVVRYDPNEQEAASQSQNQDVEIVGLAKPVGFWSKFVMSQKLGFIMARMNLQKSSGNGYWVNLIKAQASSQSKEQGKGR
jgi:hypothetical protein